MTTALVALDPGVQFSLLNDPAAPAVRSDLPAASAQFSEIMAGGPGNGVDPATVVQPPPITDGNLGDSILRKLSMTGNRYKEVANEAISTLSQVSEQTQLADLMRLQLRMSVSTLEVEIISKGVSKSVQHFDQLTKLQ